jgi:hypothetical protein
MCETGTGQQMAQLYDKYMMMMIKGQIFRYVYFLFQIENANPVPAAFTKVKITKPLDLLRQHPDWTSTYRYISVVCVSSLHIFNVVSSLT